MQAVKSRRHAVKTRWLRGGFLSLLLLGGWRVAAAELQDALDAFTQGDYQDCVRICERTVQGRRRTREDWYVLLAKAQRTLGRYADAYQTVKTGLDAVNGTSVKLLVIGNEIALFNDDAPQAQRYLEDAQRLVGRRASAYRDYANMVAIGRLAVHLGADPRWVLEVFFDPARKAKPPIREAFIAAGELALSKNDFAVASKVFQEGLEHFKQDPDLLYGLAASLENSDQEKMGAILQQALQRNPKHVPSLLLLIDHLINAEDYDTAEAMIQKVEAVNPEQPIAWAYRAVIAHLRSRPKDEETARGRALAHWKKNPEVDHIIGKKLSQKYRFTEGAAYQRRALAMDPDDVAAQVQLAQDNLRLGLERAGWRLANFAQQRDEYNVTAYNLMALRDTINRLTTLTNERFVVRMDPKEAALYGDRVLARLEAARTVLCKKYGYTLDSPVTVEIFPNQNDFGVRTFGMPHNPGFLGVCFGNVITANSPASQGGNPSNWEAVLWHEFCHVVTLHLTRNKMPRWLSEGISVYEEKRRNPAWGQSLTPDYRQRILEGKLTPISKLSAAFMRAGSGEDMQFAYYQSSLVVEFLIARYGLESLKQILHELGRGIEINEAIAARAEALPQLERAFKAFARARAEGLGQGLNWDRPERGLLAGPAGAALASNPRNYYLLMARASELLEQQQWAEAERTLNTVIAHAPPRPGTSKPLRLLAAVYRGSGDRAREKQALEKLSAIEADALDIYLRLMELASQDHEWVIVERNAERFIAVNPLVPQPYRYLAGAAEELGHRPAAIRAYENLLKLDPADPAGVHFKLARLLFQTRRPEAERQVLMALEDAPRYRLAHRLLLKIWRGKAGSKSNRSSAPGVEATDPAQPPSPIEGP